MAKKNPKKKKQDYSSELKKKVNLLKAIHSTLSFLLSVSAQKMKTFPNTFSAGK